MGKLPNLSRRKLLMIGAMLAAMPALTFSEAHAWIHGSSSFNNGKTQTNLASLGTAGQFPFIDLAKQQADFTYVNTPTLAPSVPSIPLTERDADGWPQSIVGGTNGFQAATIFMFPTAAYSGIYVLKLFGTGTVVVPGNGTTTGWIPSSGFTFSDLTFSGGGRFEFNLQNDAVSSFIKCTATGSGANTVKWALFRKVDEALYNAGQVFGVDFLAKMLQAKPAALRTLGWIGSSSDGTNNCTIATWAQRKPTTYNSYRSPQWFTAAYQGIATQSGNSFTLSGITLTDKMPLHWLAGGTAANVGQFTCNISNSTITGLPAAVTLVNHRTVVGDIWSFDNNVSPPSPFVAGNQYFVQSVVDADNVTLAATFGGAAISTTAAASGVRCGLWMSLSCDGGTTRFLVTGQNYPYPANSNPGFNLSSTGKINLGATITTLYDQAMVSHVMTIDGNGGPASCGFYNGVPVEYCIDLCGKIGAMPWIIVPFMAMESASGANNVTDFDRGAAAYAQSAWPYMKPAFEPPNETWNGGQEVFRATFYAPYVAWQRWQVSADGLNQAYGSWAPKLAADLYSFYGNDYSKFIAMCSFQTTPAWSASVTPTTGGQNNRLLSAAYVAANGGNTAFAAYKNCNAVCMDSYFAPGDRKSCNELVTAFAWTVTNAGNSSAQSTNAESYTSTLNGSVTNSAPTIDYRLRCYNNLIAYVGTLSGTTISTIDFYEGGYSPDYLGSSSSTGNGIAWKTVIANAVSNGTKTDLTLAAVSSNTENSAAGGALTGNPAVVGMGLSPTGATGMTGLNLPDSSSATFTASSANITVSTNTPPVGMAVCFNLWQNNILSGAAMPGGIVQGQPYYVVSQVGSVIQVSATKGGSPITITTAPAGGTMQVEQCYVITAVSGNQVTIDYDSSAQPAYTASSGTASYTFSGSMSNNLRYAGKFTNNLGTQNTAFTNAVFALLGLTPKYFSNFVYFGNQVVWYVEDPNIYAASTPQWLSIVAANN